MNTMIDENGEELIDADHALKIGEYAYHNNMNSLQGFETMIERKLYVAALKDLVESFEETFGEV